MYTRTYKYTRTETQRPCKSERANISNQWYIIIQLNRHDDFLFRLFRGLIVSDRVFSSTVAIFSVWMCACVNFFYLCSHCKWTLRLKNDTKIMRKTATAMMATTAATAYHSYKFEEKKNWKYARKRHRHCTSHHTNNMYSYWILIIIVEHRGKKNAKWRTLKKNGKKRWNERQRKTHTYNQIQTNTCSFRHSRYMYMRASAHKNGVYAWWCGVL